MNRAASDVELLVALVYAESTTSRTFASGATSMRSVSASRRCPRIDDPQSIQPEVRHRHVHRLRRTVARAARTLVRTSKNARATLAPPSQLSSRPSGGSMPFYRHGDVRVLRHEEGHFRVDSHFAQTRPADGVHPFAQRQSLELLRTVRRERHQA